MTGFLLAAFLSTQTFPAGDGCNTCTRISPTVASCTLLYCGPLPELVIAPLHPNPKEFRVHDKRDRAFAPLLVSFLSAQAADTALTLHQRARYGYVERNPILTNHTTGIVLTKAAITTAGAVTAWKWRKSHPRVAKAILIIGTASATAATIYNARQYRRRQG